MDKLGQGGMASVWTARHLTLNVDVAVKFMDAAAKANDESALKRFEQEAKAAAAIVSPHVVKILDYGKDQSGRPYLAMELLKGEELDYRLNREGPMPLDVVRKVIGEACKGLGAAHAKGVIHRDLKPENVFLAKDHEGYSVKILDFGIARADPELTGHGNLTMTGQLIGTPMFMSPEQALGKKNIDGRSDLYSLGVVAFKCLTGQLPYEESETVGEIIVSITTKEPRDAAALRSDLPPAVVAWVKRALAKPREDRFQTAKEMADALEEACDVRKMAVSFSGLEVDDTVPPETDFGAIERPSSVPPPGTGAATDAAEAERKALAKTSASSRPLAKEKPKESRWWVVALVLLVSAGLALAWVKLR